ncbi:MAG: GNAT family N-acetyltransferase [Planctomycetes bacterium]|nr:GNAT family N-acetyltransferase [Planctomycetota bacterium]
MSTTESIPTEVTSGASFIVPLTAAPAVVAINRDMTTLRATVVQANPAEVVSRDDWNRLAGDVPFRQFDWQTGWWRHYSRSASRPWTITVRDGHGELVGLLPLFLQATPIAGRVLQMLGSGEVCSDYLTLMAVPGCESAVVDAVAACLSSEQGSHWDALVLDGVTAADQNIQLLRQALERAGHQSLVSQPYSTWRIALPPTWPEYVAGLSKRRRDWVKKLQKQYFDTGRAVARIITSEAELDAAWPMFQDLHQKRRTSLGESGCFASTEFDQFHTEQARVLLAAGQLRLHWVELDGQPAAVEYGVVAGRTLYLYQSGFEPTLGKHKPGWLNTIASVRTAIDQQLEVIDFMRGDEPYKASWLARPCPLNEVRVVGRHAIARLRQRVLLLGASVRRQWRKYHESSPTPETPTEE